jgi:HEAT repeat protein
MKKRTWLLFWSGLVALAVGIGVYIGSSNPPAYQGRGLFSWLNDLTPANSFRSPPVQFSMPTGRVPASNLNIQSFMNLPGATVAYAASTRNPHLEASDAIRAMGTNSLPFLLSLLHKQDGALKASLLKLLKKQSLLKLQPVSAEQRRGQALSALNELGPIAAPAWRTLVADKGATPELRRMAILALGTFLGEPEASIPVLLAETGDPTMATYANSAILHYGARSALPILIQYVGGTNLDCEIQALDMLQSFGRQAKAAAPVLSRRLDSTSAGMRERTAVTLLSCDPENLSAMLLLLNSPPVQRRVAICWDLERLHPQAANIVPALALCLKDPEPRLREAAAQTLSAYGAQANSAIPLLTALLQDPNPSVRSSATKALAAISSAQDSP